MAEAWSGRSQKFRPKPEADLRKLIEPPIPWWRRLIPKNTPEQIHHPLRRCTSSTRRRLVLGKHLHTHVGNGIEDVEVGVAGRHGVASENTNLGAVLAHREGEAK